MSAIFYQEDLKIDFDSAQIVSQFMDIASSNKAIVTAKPWADHGICRVYIELWSQNKLDPIERVEKFYFDIGSCQLLAKRFAYGITTNENIKDILKGKSNFSGAKTRAAIEILSEEVDKLCQKHTQV